MARTKVPKVSIPPPDLEVPSRDPGRHSDRLHAEARLVYLMHPDGISLEELQRDPRFNDVPLNTIHQWCKAEGWVAERKEVFSKWADKAKLEMQKQLYSRIAQVKIGQLKTVEELLEDLRTKSLNAEVKSAESAAKVALELMKYQTDLANSVASELTPGGSGAGAIEPRNRLTEDEVLEAARVVLAGRRRAAAQGLPPPAPMKVLGPGGTNGAEGA